VDRPRYDHPLEMVPSSTASNEVVQYSINEQGHEYMTFTEMLSSVDRSVGGPYSSPVNQQQVDLLDLLIKNIYSP